MKSRSLGIVLAVALATAGTFALVSYVRSADDRAIAGEDVVSVFVVERAIPRGTAVEDLNEFIAEKEVPTRLRAEGAVSSIDELAGLVAIVDLVEGEQIVATRFSASGAAATAVSGAPPGWLVVTLELDRVRSLDGALGVGDYVAVLGSFGPFDENSDEATPAVSERDSETPGPPPQLLASTDRIDTPTASGYIARHAIVMAVTATSVVDESDGQRALPKRLHVTLAMPADDIEQTIFAAEFGSIWLAQDPSTAGASTPGPQTRESIFVSDSEPIETESDDS